MVPLLLLSGGAWGRRGPRGASARESWRVNQSPKNLRTAVRRDYAVAMSDPIVILTEEPLGPDDRVNIAKLLDGGDAPPSLSWSPQTQSDIFWSTSWKTCRCLISPRRSGN